MTNPNLLPSLFFIPTEHCLPAGWQSSPAGRTDQSFRVQMDAFFYARTAHTRHEVKHMSYVSPNIRSQFESMPIHLKNAILERDVHLENMADLMSCLEQIIKEGERRA